MEQEVSKKKRGEPLFPTQSTSGKPVSRDEVSEKSQLIEDCSIMNILKENSHFLELMF